MREKVEALIAEHERLFPRKMAVEQVRATVRTAMEAHMKFPELAPLLDVLSRAKQEGIAESTVFLPETPQGFAMVVEWLHGNQMGNYDMKETIATNRQLFLLAHSLRKQQCTTDMFVEGPPYDFSYKQPETARVPGTSVPLYCDQGQELLLADPKHVDTLIGRGGQLSRRTFLECLWHKQFQGMHGIEKPESHNQTIQEISQLAHLKPLAENDLMLINGLLKEQTVFTRSTPRICMFGTYSTYLSELIERCERYCAAVELFTRLHVRRDGEMMARMEETIPTGIPKIFCGMFHSVNLRKFCGERNIGLILTTPMGSPPINDTYFNTRTDQQNSNYQIIKCIIPQLQAINKS
ncbi:MAG: hypothetical protein PHO54_02560 [Candidatus Peribacteraceae bacterium]|nr:hypothetical protein [Candidatus Peribacteraceae bacterium]